MKRAIVGLFAMVAVALGCMGCTPAQSQAFDSTQRAAASLALDFSDCVKQEFVSLASAGMLSKDAAFASAEQCGIANIKDGLALLVAAFNDVKNYLIAQHSTAVKSEPFDAGAVPVQ